MKNSSSEERKVAMNGADADLALKAFAKVAAGLELDWCLFAGTALGLFRDKKYLPGDNDIDLAVKAKPEQLDDLWWALYKEGFKLGRFCKNADGTSNRHLYYKNGTPWPDEGGVLVDVFYTFTEEEENLVRFFDAISYKDDLYLVPHPIDVYLQCAYGDWWDRERRDQAKGKEGLRW